MISLGPLSSTQARDYRDHAGGLPKNTPSAGAGSAWSDGSEAGARVHFNAQDHLGRGVDPPSSDHTGMTSGLSLGNLVMVASLTFRCWATIAGGVWAIQSDRETSAKYGALKTSRNCKSVSPVFLM